MIKSLAAANTPFHKPRFLLLAIVTFLASGMNHGHSGPPEEKRCSSTTLSARSCVCSGASCRTYRSRHFLMHTDLSEEEALKQLDSLESVLQFATKYWRRPSPGLIECYVADDVSAWPDAALPHRLARVSIVHIGGATVAVPCELQGSESRRAMFYARAGEGIAEHESIHAYCLQAFGATGPTWYKEGMAEVGGRCGNDAAGVSCPPSYVDYFNVTPKRTVREIVNQGASTAGISRTLPQIRESSSADLVD